MASPITTSASPDRPSLAVIVPVYDEAATIAYSLDRVFERGRPDQVIVVDDGSTDDTAAIVEQSRHGARIELVRHERNRGKGAAIRTAIPRVRCEAVIIQDGDLEYDPADYDRLLVVMRNTGSPVVYGSRYLSLVNPYSTLGFYLGGRALSWWSNLLFGLQITDEPTCYKLFRTSLLKQIPLREDGFEFCPEVTGYLGRLGIAIPEVPIGYQPRSISEGKKITPADGLRAFGVLWRLRTQPLEQLLTGTDSHTGQRRRGSDPALLKLADRLRMDEARNYTRWMLARFGPYLGDHVLEVAAGIGTYTEPLIRTGKQVTACEAAPQFTDMLHTRVGGSDHLTLIESPFSSDAAQSALGAAAFDSVLCINELAFVERPDRLLALAHQRLRVGGRLLLLVPAGPRSFGSLDRALGHRRRYDRRGLEAALRAQRWSIEILRYTNALGLAGWTLNARLLRKSKQSPSQILLFDRLMVPALRAMERHVQMPAGQSLLAVVRR